MSRVAISLANAVLRVRVRVRANAAETRILAVREERVDIAVTAPAREGAAGKGVVAVVSKVLGVPRSTVLIVSGMKAQDKVLNVEWGEGKVKERIDGVEGALQLFKDACAKGAEF